MSRVRRKKNGLRERKAALGYLFALPWLIGFILFTLYPLVYSVFISTQHVEIGSDGIVTSPIGFANYMNALTLDINLITATVDALRFVGVLTPLIIILSLIIGLLLSQNIWFRGAFRAIYFFPVIIISGSLMGLLQANGVFDIVDLTQNGIIRWIDGMGLGVFVDTIMFLLNNIFTVLWFSGVQILIYLSGIQKISPYVYEAAFIDGASRWQSFWKITLPSMNQFTIINVLYTVVSLATFGGNAVVLLIKTYMFSDAGMQGMGYASAVSWLYFILIVIILLIALALIGVRPKRKGGAA